MMTAVQRRTTAAFSSGQSRRDSATPNEALAFLDTTAGANWLAGAAEDLVAGRDLIVGKAVAVRASALSDAVAAEAVRRLGSNQDPEGMLGQLLVAVDNFDISTASACLKSLFHDQRGPRGVFQQMASELAAEVADQAAEQLQLDAEEELIEMRYAG
ncbi:hypothetical protein [Pseudomonas solani]|uniref:hypothetical protein n=1 Tax=Pseudomonas solani TaxID=2731552 RepID=UPI003D6A3D5D